LLWEIAAAFPDLCCIRNINLSSHRHGTEQHEGLQGQGRIWWTKEGGIDKEGKTRYATEAGGQGAASCHNEGERTDLLA
jgi:hypothetical protein